MIFKMNKVQFRYIKTGICAFALLATMSCQSDFLKEELTTQRSNAYYSTDEGIQAAVTGAYNQTFNVPLSGRFSLQLLTTEQMSFMLEVMVQTALGTITTEVLGLS
jgi:hypothetical protein